MHTDPSYDEKELLLRIAQHDERAFQQLFTQYWRKIYSISLMYAKVPEVAEDATQDVFLQIWNKRTQLAGVISVEAYLFTTAKHTVFNMLRKRLFSGESDVYLADYFADELSSPIQQLEIKELGKILIDGIDQLSPQQQKVFRLSRIQGMTHAEIAAQLGLSTRTVKNYMISAIQFLRDYLQRHSQIPGKVLPLVLLVLGK